MFFKQIFEPKLAQYSYLIGCQKNGTAIIIDPMRDVDVYFEMAKKENLNLIAAADTHIHADYVSGLQELAEKGLHIYASDEGDADWKYNWLKANNKYNATFVKDGDRFSLGNIHFDVLHTPGHTPEHISFMVTDGAATQEPMGILSGDFVFVGDVGRPDLLESAAGVQGMMRPSAERLFNSLEQFKKMPEYLKVWPAHGAGSACGKALGAVPDSTVGYEVRFSSPFKYMHHVDNFVDFILDGQPEPPLYFARMKKVNRDGINVLGNLPKPAKMTAEEVAKAGGVILDSRTRAEFMAAHLKGSYCAPFDKAYNTVAGSYVSPEEKVYLVIDTHQVEAAVRDLVRVGVDNIIGYVTIAEFKEYLEKNNAVKTTVLKFDDLKTYQENGYEVLDVRKKTEYDIDHAEGSKNIAHVRIPRRIEELDKNKKYLVHCQAGGRAAAAASYLDAKGFDVVMIDDAFENFVNAHVEPTF
ncbi:MBL fold metallo-hydrolase [bacterium]|nr:MAG: MBL fold metallo-hydrolase [bacterium]